MGIVIYSENFENPSHDWFFAGNAGFDLDKGLARQGRGNAWVRNYKDWNAINIWRPVYPQSVYKAFAWLRFSSNLKAGYMSVRNDNEDGGGDFTVIKEIKLVGPAPDNPDQKGYNPYEFEFFTGNNSRILFYIGLHGKGDDEWIQIDEVSLSTKTDY